MAGRRRTGHHGAATALTATLHEPTPPRATLRAPPRPEAVPLCATLGARAIAMGGDEVVLAVDWAPGLCTSGGLLHGGVLMARGAPAGGACAFANLPEGAVGTSTIESKTNFLRAVRGGALTGTAR